MLACFSIHSSHYLAQFCFVLQLNLRRSRGLEFLKIVLHLPQTRTDRLALHLQIPPPRDVKSCEQAYAILSHLLLFEINMLMCYVLTIYMFLFAFCKFTISSSTSSFSSRHPVTL